MLEEAVYEDGAVTGVWRRYFPTGILAMEGKFHEGERTGAWDEFDEQGVHRIRRHYLNGGKYGPAIKYFQKDPEIEVWSSVGRLDPETMEPIDEQALAVVP
jgi:antitoxin component YwqK of YwqJK toxin-antitoxin module